MRGGREMGLENGGRQRAREGQKQRQGSLRGAGRTGRQRLPRTETRRL